LKPRRVNRNKDVIVIAAMLTALMFASAYAASTRLVWPFGALSAYYLPPNVNHNVPSLQIELPIEFFLASSESLAVTYSDSQVSEIVNATSDIWLSNANITFHLVGVHRLTVAENSLQVSSTNEAVSEFGSEFLGEKFRDDVIDVVIMRSLKDAKEGGGIAVAADRIILSSEFENRAHAYWNLAHELGHILNLRDVIQADNLMQADELPGNVEYKKRHLPTRLTDEQVLMTRSWAYQVLCSEGSCLRDD